MAKKRQLVLTRSRKDASPDDPLPPLGSQKEVLAALAPFNTSPDGGPPGLGTMTLWGPGMTVSLPTTQKEITQLIANLTDEEIALPVLMRACKSLGWAMTDLSTGRTFG
jgi:hypothetical protein